MSSTTKPTTETNPNLRLLFSFFLSAFRLEQQQTTTLLSLARYFVKRSGREQQKKTVWGLMDIMNEKEMVLPSSMGLTLTLPPELASRLRRTSASSSATKKIPSSTAAAETAKTGTNSKHQVENDCILPTISIDLNRLVGYEPQPEEILSIQSQLISAMWGRYNSNNNNRNSGETDGIVVDNDNGNSSNNAASPPPDFDQQVLELYETGVATFGTKQGKAMMILHYPSMLQSPITGMNNISTIKLWKEIQTYPKTVTTMNPTKTTKENENKDEQQQEQQEKQQLLHVLVTKLWTYLQTCSRGLFWKRDMSKELSILIKEEQERLDYNEWKNSKRQLKLDNLYTIRETMVFQVEVAKSKVDMLEEEREGKVKELMQEYHRNNMNKNKKGDATTLDSFGTTELSFPEEFQLLGLRDEQTLYQDEDDWGLGDEDDYIPSEYSESNDDDDDDDDNIDDDYSTSSEQKDDKKSTKSETKVDEITEPSTTEENTTTTYATAKNNDTDAKKNSSSSLFVQNETNNNVADDDVMNVTGTTDVNASINDIGNIDLDGVDIKNDTTTTSNIEKNSSGHVLSTPFLRRKERREKLKQKKRQQRREEEKRKRLQQVQQMENVYRTQYTTKEMIMSQTVYNALQTKLSKIEDLLDSLQDEVWEAQEEAEQEKLRGVNDGSETKKLSSSSSQDEENPSFSLLDQVLAMILGSLPVQEGMSQQEHYSFIQKEHQMLIQQWKNYFGRLPQPAGGGGAETTTTKAKEEKSSSSSLSKKAKPSTVTSSNGNNIDNDALKQRQALGITENDDEDWDDVEDWDEFLVVQEKNQLLPNEQTFSKGKEYNEMVKSTTNEIKEEKEKGSVSEESKPKPKPKLVGLRPGGSTKR